MNSSTANQEIIRLGVSFSRLLPCQISSKIEDNLAWLPIIRKMN